MMRWLYIFFKSIYLAFLNLFYSLKFKKRYLPSESLSDGTNLFERLPDEMILEILKFNPPHPVYCSAQRFYRLRNHNYLYNELLNSTDIQDDIQSPIVNLTAKLSLFEEQQDEISYLLKNKAKIKPEPDLEEFFVNIEGYFEVKNLPLENASKTLYLRHKLLNAINVALFKRAINSQYGFVFNLCLTRFPSELIKDAKMLLKIKQKHVVRLDISQNYIHRLPKCIGALKHLEVILIKNNQIGSLPDNFSQLHNLQRVDLSHNNLTEVSALNSLPDLRIAGLSYNHLNDFDLPETVILSSEWKESVSKEEVLATQVPSIIVTSEDMKQQKLFF